MIPPSIPSHKADGEKQGRNEKACSSPYDVPRNSGGVCGNVTKLSCCWGERKRSEKNNTGIGGFGFGMRRRAANIHTLQYWSVNVFA